MCLRSAYFQQIEEDVQKYAKSITELRSVISTFKTKDMAELIKFHKNVECILENLTDESQVHIIYRSLLIHSNPLDHITLIVTSLSILFVMIMTCNS